MFRCVPDAVNVPEESMSTLPAVEVTAATEAFPPEFSVTVVWPVAVAPSVRVVPLVTERAPVSVVMAPVRFTVAPPAVVAVRESAAIAPEPVRSSPHVSVDRAYTCDPECP